MRFFSNNYNQNEQTQLPLHSFGFKKTRVEQFEFFMEPVVVEACLCYTKGLTVALQSQSIDICTAYREANVVKSVLTDVRKNINQNNNRWYNLAVQLSARVNGNSPSIPRRCSRQTQRDNVPAETPEEYYRRSLTIPFLDHILSHMETRFSGLQQKAVMALQITPSVILQNTHQANVEENNSDELVDFFKDDLPSPSTVDQEI